MAHPSLPPFGWCEATPATPTDRCRWCRRAHVTTETGAVVCLRCDDVRMWPSNAGGS